MRTRLLSPVAPSAHSSTRCLSVLPVVLLTGLLAALLVVPAGPAEAAARVSVRNSAGQASIAATGSTTLRLSGSGFQSVKGGFGGIYVLFGAVNGTWRPSAHGGGGMYYLPDSRSKSNAGHQRFVAFPGTSTGGEANGGTISARGTWSTTLSIPGASFTGVGPGGESRAVDCRTMTCGVITIGAHGVANARNETFTPVRVSEAAPGAATTQAPATTAPDPGIGQATAAPAAPTPTVKLGKPKLVIDRASARAGRVLAFTGRGLPPGRQLSAVLDDGLAGAGPLTVGLDGTLAGVIQVPADVGPGTHELRLVGMPKAPSVRFAVADAATPAAVEPTAATATEKDGPSRPAVAFVAASASALLLALVFAALRHHRQRRRTDAG